jgi:hypothetical protein
VGRIANRIKDMIINKASGREIVAEIEKMEARALAAVERSSLKAKEIEPLFLEWWTEYPHKTGKPVARRSYTKAVENGVDPVEILVGLRRYKHSKPADRPWLNPATFLNQERWLDQPAAPTSGNVGDFFGQMADHFGGRDNENFHQRREGRALEAPRDALPGPHVHGKG